MRGPYDVTFDDGTVERVEADSATDAKFSAKSIRLRALDPTGTRTKGGDAPNLLSHGSVKVARVVEALAILLSVGIAGALYGLDRLLGGDGSAVAFAGVMDLMAFSTTAIGATLANMTAVSGDNAQVPFFPENKKAWLLQIWNDVQAAGTSVLRSPKWHDNVNGMRFDTIISDPTPLLPDGVKQPLFSGDQLIAQLAGSATAGDIEFVVLLRYFEELSAQHSRMIGWDELMRRGVNVITVENTIATVATGLWGGSEAINAEIDQLHTRTQYAIVGYHVDTECAAVAWRGPDFANVRVGGPGIETDRNLTRMWFTELARLHNMPLIPVFNADNKAATFVEALQDENGADTTLTTILVELAPEGGR